MTRRSSWLLPLPLMVAGSQAAHSLAYRLEVPDPHARARVLEATGHSYFSQAPLVVAILLALLLVALAAQAVGAARNRPGPLLPAAAFAVLPALGFTLQEHLERLFETGSFPFGAALDPTFWPGLLLQLPFGLAAYLLARLLVRAARTVGRSFAVSAALRPTAPPLLRLLPTRAELPRIPVPAAGHGVRGPPR